MACDYTLTLKKRSADSAIFRLYTWEQPTISLGFHQETEDIDLELCSADGVDVVRRPTGGRAIYHRGEITYCFIQTVNPDEARSALREVYSKVHRALAAALLQAGAPVTLAGGKRIRNGHNPLCFASAAGTELEIGGRKVVGSAQRLLDGSILQHGSILLDDAHLNLPKYLKAPLEVREQMLEKLKRSSTTLPLQDTSEFRKSLALSIANIFQGDIIESYLTTDEIAEIDRRRGDFAFQMKFPTKDLSRADV